MRAEKILNNNAVVCLDDAGREVVAMGRGLAFQLRAGAEVDFGRVEKIFRSDTSEFSSKFQELVSQIPIEHILLAEKVIAFAKEHLHLALRDSIYVSLPDHISTAIERYAEGMVLKNPVLMDIKRFYRDEYRVGEKALALIREETGLAFAEDEAGFIAMHFVNAQMKGETEDFHRITRLVEAIASLVLSEITGDVDEDSISWYRFITHVRFFVERLVMEKEPVDASFELCALVEKQFPIAFACARNIASLVERECGQTISEEEMTCLAMHIERLSGRHNKENAT